MLLDARQCPRAAATSEEAIKIQAPEEDAKGRGGLSRSKPPGPGLWACGGSGGGDRETLVTWSS